MEASFTMEKDAQDFVATMVCKMYGDVPGNHIVVKNGAMFINYRKRWSI